MGIFYTPRLFSKASRANEDHQLALTSIYSSLIEKIKINLVDGQTVFLKDIECLKIQAKKVYILRKQTKEQTELKDFEIKGPHLKFITLDHEIPFYELVKKNHKELKNMKLLTSQIRGTNQSMNKERMRKQYSKVLKHATKNIDNLIREIKFLADKTELTLMPSQLNYSKGKTNPTDC